MTSTSRKSYRVQPVEREGRTFEITLTSNITGYFVRVYELLPKGSSIPISVHAAKYRIAPASFYRSRLHYRGLLIGEVLGELRHGNVQRLESADSDLVKYDSYICANLIGWPEGYEDSCEDDLKDWDVSNP
jgi:hypothetical protein